MMEESSEKRRERLQAMRMEANASSCSPHTTNTTAASFSSPSLSNPFAGPSNLSSPSSTGQRMPNFDFYTNPMAGYSSSSSSSARRRFDDKQEAQQQQIMQSNFSPHQPLNQGFQPPFNQTPPFPESGNYRSYPQNQVPEWRSPGGLIGAPQGHIRSPRFDGWSGSHSTPQHYSRSPGSAQGGGRGRHSYNMSPGSGRGRGRGRNSYNMSPESGRGGGRGCGSVPAQNPPETLFNKTMLEDPWKDLKPIVKLSSKEPESSRQIRTWLPNSLSTKKAKLDEKKPKFATQSSIADCLTFAFEDAVNES